MSCALDIERYGKATNFGWRGSHIVLCCLLTNRFRVAVIEK